MISAAGFHQQQYCYPDDSLGLQSVKELVFVVRDNDQDFCGAAQ